jgi:RNA polymerase sigma-70 factor, ECF subfamily
MRPQSEPTSPEHPRGATDDDPAAAEPLDDTGGHLSALVRAELPWVWRLLRRFGLSSEDADDATQQVSLVAARRKEEVQGSRARPFLYGTAVRVAANARRTLARRRDTPSDAISGAATHEPPTDEQVEQRRARVLLDELLDKLPAELRRVLVLAEIEQLTVREIAELEAIPAGTAASRLRRARALFYDLLEQEQHRNPFDRRCS